MGSKGKARTIGPHATSVPTTKLDNFFCTNLRGDGWRGSKNHYTGVYKPPFSPPSRGGKNISPLSEQGRKLAVFLKKNKRQMLEHKEEE